MTTEEQQARNSQVVQHESPVGTLITLFKVLKIAVKPHNLNCSPVDIVTDLRELNRDHLEESVGDLERILLANGVTLTELLLKSEDNGSK